MSRFIRKWAGWSKKSNNLKSLKLPGSKPEPAEAKVPDLKDAMKGKPGPEAVKRVDTTPAAASPSAALPDVTNQASTSSQGIGSVYTNTSSPNYAKMASSHWAEVVELMRSGSVCENVLNMRPR